jgi:hypothetical protein
MSDEQQMRPDPANEIPESIRTGAEPFYVLVVSDDGGGKPITWEHHVPAATGLLDVIRKQAQVGERYGASYIAECRILPSLTQDPASNQLAEPKNQPNPQPGQVWLSRGGQSCVVRANECFSTDCSYPIASNLKGYHAHWPDGRSCLSLPQYDLIELISEAPVQTAELEAPPKSKQVSEPGEVATSPQSAFSRIFMRLFGQRRNG